MEKMNGDEIKKIDGDLCHDILAKNMKGELEFDENADFDIWRNKVKDKFIELLGINEIRKNACELAPEIVKTEKKDGYTQFRFQFESEIGATVPCYLLIPDGKTENLPLFITLQGHSTGFHNSIGEPHDDEEAEYAETRGDFARQAVRNGYAALAIEQRAMGERITRRHPFDVRMCAFSAFSAMELGRTIIGERVWDVSRAIDALQQLAFPEVNLDKIAITGSSGGGTASFYAACFDERIKLACPACSFCSYKTSVLSVYHCACNYIPGVKKYCEMEDFACLIAPRNFIVFTGELDKIFPIDGVKDSFETVKKIYAKANAADKCALVTMPKGHWWCKDIVWERINTEIKRLGW